MLGVKKSQKQNNAPEKSCRWLNSTGGRMTRKESGKRPPNRGENYDSTGRTATSQLVFQIVNLEVTQISHDTISWYQIAKEIELAYVFVLPIRGLHLK